MHAGAVGFRLCRTRQSASNRGEGRQHRSKKGDWFFEPPFFLLHVTTLHFVCYDCNMQGNYIPRQLVKLRIKNMEIFYLFSLLRCIGKIVIYAWQYAWQCGGLGRCLPARGSQ